MPNIEGINSSQTAKMGKVQSHNTKVNADSARAFVSAFKEAEKQIKQVPENNKKLKQNETKKEKVLRKRKEDFEAHDEVAEILAEIDKRLEQLLKMAE